MQKVDRSGRRLASSAQQNRWVGLHESLGYPIPPFPSPRASADFYGRFFNTYKITSEDATRRSVINQFAMLEETSQVLEIGAGGGLLTEMLAEKSKTVALDLAMYPDFSKMLGTTKNVSFVVGTASQLPCRDSLFDLVICSEVLEHVPRVQRCDVLDEIGRVLKPGGRAIITTPNPESIAARLRRLAFRIQKSHSHDGSQLYEEWLPPSELQSLLVNRLPATAYLAFYAELPVLHRLLGPLGRRLNGLFIARTRRGFLHSIFLYQGVIVTKTW